MAAITGSSVLAEQVHSVADSANQVLLLIGGRAGALTNEDSARWIGAGSRLILGG